MLQDEVFIGGMMQEELISKKELLLKTGISYGQLYRWKRQQLIPDAWFMKQSSYTGQETFFPKRKVLERIRTILQMKDSHSLEDLAAFFAPESADRSYVLMDVREEAGLTSSDVDLCIQLWGKYRVSFIELLLLSMLPDLDRDAQPTDDERREWIMTARRWADAGAKADRVVVVFRKRAMLSYVLLDAPGRCETDEGSVLIGGYDLSERARRLQLQLHQMTEG